jgi:Arc/MetJ-type ribon-helix-helix transcriptional regulator
MAMRKTTVYLAHEEAEGLRRLSAETGKSQAELVREGVRRLLGQRGRKFHSLGLGKGTGKPALRGRSDAVYRETMGKE